MSNFNGGISQFRWRNRSGSCCWAYKMSRNPPSIVIIFLNYFSNRLEGKKSIGSSPFHPSYSIIFLELTMVVTSRSITSSWFQMSTSWTIILCNYMSFGRNITYFPPLKKTFFSTFISHWNFKFYSWHKNLNDEKRGSFPFTMKEFHLQKYH